MTKHVPSPILRNISKTGKRKAGNEQMYLREKELNTGECHPTVDIQSYSEWRDEGSMVRLSFCSVQLFSCVWLFETPWTACQASLSITKSWRLLKVMSIELVMPSNHLILCLPLVLLPSIFSSIRVFSNESVLHIRWPKYWSFRFSISLSNEYSGLISFRMDWLDLLAVQGTLKSLLQHHSSKASILWCSGFFLSLTFLHDYWKNQFWLDGPLLAKECLWVLIYCLGWS